MSPRVIALGLLALAACASGADDKPVDARARDGSADLDGPAGEIDATLADAGDLDGALVDAAVIDAPMIDAMPTDAPPPTGGTLVLTELVLGPAGAEMIEIANPTGAPVTLTNYYLTDVPKYWRLPAGTAGTEAGNSDFIARFPAGATIASGGVATIALDTAAAFTTAYGSAPTFSLGTGAGMMTIVGGSAPTLTNGGEPVALFYWDGASDLVSDIDLMNAGTPSAANLLVTKSGVAIDGPDSGTTTTAYRADANTLPTQSAPGNMLSTKRTALATAATEVQTGGNGLTGHDETSEQTGTTWDGSPYTAPTPGAVPAALLP